jgi:splicing factor U2AF subunit
MQMVAPRPMEGAEVPGLGKIYIKYEKSKEAADAHRTLAGRKFDGRVVITTFFDDIKFGKGKLE